MTACILYAYTNINPSTMQNKQKKRRKKNPIESLLTRIYFFIHKKLLFSVPYKIYTQFGLLSIYKCVRVSFHLAFKF